MDCVIRTRRCARRRNDKADMSRLLNSSLITFVSVSLAVTSAKAINYGVYDFANNQSQSHRFQVEHIFVPYGADLIRQLNNMHDRGRKPLVTIEPWGCTLADTFSGKKDAVIKRMAQEVVYFGKPVIIRWGHEMENQNGRYPWAHKAPASYIAAYRHF